MATKNTIIAGLLLSNAAVSALALRTTFTGTHDPTPALESLATYTFADFVKSYEKQYASEEEYARREAIFKKNLETIKAHNAKPNESYTLNVNHLADWTPMEFKALMGQIPNHNRDLYSKLKVIDRDELPPTPSSVLKNLPPSVDWRNKSVVTPVKDQGDCGSCWAFASTETMESQWAIATGQLLELSTQQVTECTPNPDECGGTGGCDGATENLAFDYVIKAGGIVTAASYPYTASDTGCNVPAAAKRVAFFESIVKVKTNDQDDMLNVLATQGPVTIGVWADPLQFYSSGVFSGCSYTSNMDIDHAVQLVGYGTDVKLGKDYWIVRNSWGSSWGEKGYVRLQRDAVAQCGTDRTPKDGSACKNDPDTPIKVCGQCGLLYESSYPVPKTTSSA